MACAESSADTAIVLVVLTPPSPREGSDGYT